MTDPRQMVLPGLEDSPWRLLDRPPVYAHGGAGADRLLRALVREGLDPDDMPAAARLVLELDAEARS